MEERKVKIVEEYIIEKIDNYEIVFKTIYKDVYFKVYAYVKSESDAKDITQEVLLEIYRSVRSLRKPQNFPRWLNVIVFRRCMDYIHSKNGRLKVESTEFNDEYHKLPQTSYEPTMEEILGVINDFVSTKAQDIEDIIRLKYQGGYTYPEIAKIIGVHEKTIRNRMYTFKKELGQALKVKKIDISSLYGTSLSPFLLGYATTQLTPSLPILYSTLPLSNFNKIRKARGTLQKTVIIGVGTIAAGLGFLLKEQAPSFEIKAIEDDPYHTYTHVIMDMNKKVNPIYLKSKETIYEIEKGNNGYETNIYKNGTYEVITYQDTKVESLYTLVISTLDDVAPKFVEYINTKDGIEFVVEEDNFDLQASYALINNEMIQFTRINNTTFHVACEKYSNIEFYLYDKSGNMTTYTILYTSGRKD